MAGTALTLTFKQPADNSEENEMKITATINKGQPNARTVEAEADIPQDLDGLVEKFGKDVVASNAIDSIVISVQALMRRGMSEVTNKDGKVTRAALSDDEIKANVASWKPEARGAAVRMTAFERAKAAVSTMTAEQKAALLEQLRAA